MLIAARNGPGRDDLDADARGRGARHRLDEDQDRVDAGRREVRQPELRRRSSSPPAATASAACGRSCATPARPRARCSSPPPRRRGASPRTRCTTEKGEVVHKASGRRFEYGALVDKAAALPVPKDVTLKDPKDFTLLGKSVAAPRYSREGERHGRVRHGREAPGPARRRASCAARCSAARSPASTPTRRRPFPASSTSCRSAAASPSSPTTTGPRRKGAQALEVKWDEGTLATLNSADIMKKYAALAEAARQGRAQRRQRRRGARQRSPKKFERVFEAPFLAHATMEPMNCTADVKADSCDV